jgi:hypothetical protein
MNAMAKEPAEVINSFIESLMAGIRVAGQFEKERVSAFFAYVLVVDCTAGDRDIVMPAEKAGERMSNT